MVDPPNLTVEIIPTSLHGVNPRSLMGRAAWDRIRRQVAAEAGNRCEICGGVGPSHPVEVHERYEYDESVRPPCQRIIGLIALCPDCHSVKHLARTRLIAREQNDPAIYERALQHLAQVNGWDPSTVQTYLTKTAGDFQRREALGRWTHDFSMLTPGQQA